MKSRYQAFENVTTNGNGHMEKSPVSVKRSPSILSKLAKYVFLMVFYLIYVAFFKFININNYYF